jgi:hypothetical protein
LGRRDRSYDALSRAGNSLGNDDLYQGQGKPIRVAIACPAASQDALRLFNHLHEESITYEDSLLTPLSGFMAGKSRSLHSACPSLRECQAPVGMTMWGAAIWNELG